MHPPRRHSDLIRALPPPRRTICLVACSKQKRAHAAPARDLYTSALFRKSRAYAEYLVGAGQAQAWMILSARWGLIPAVGKSFSPYDETLARMTRAERRAWGHRVLRRLVSTRVPSDYRYGWALSPSRDRYVLLAGRLYREPLVAHLDEVEVPLRGLGIGQQLAWLKRHTPAMYQGSVPLIV